MPSDDGLVMRPDVISSERLELAKGKMYLACDESPTKEALALVEEIGQHFGGLKFGYERIFASLAEIGCAESEEDAAAAGVYVWRFLRMLRRKGFIDAKLADIPNTTGMGTANIARLMPLMLNVHASSGMESMKAAVKHKGDAEVFAVTVLTSIKEEEALRIFGMPMQEKVIQFTCDAAEAGCDGVICPATMLEMLKKLPQLAKMKYCVPGTRSAWAPANDQNQVMTPAQAIQLGADRLVIGRQVTKPPKGMTRTEASMRTMEEIAAVL